MTEGAAIREAAGPIVVCGATGLGILAAEGLAAGPGHDTALAAALTSGAAMVLGGRRARILAVTAVFLLAATVALRARHGVESSPLTEPAGRRAAVVIQGVLVSDPVPRRFTTRAVVRVERFTESASATVHSGGGRHLLVVLGRSAGTWLIALEAGDGVVLEGRLAPLAPRERWWWRRHVAARLDAGDIHEAHRPRSPWMRWSNTLRRAVLAGTDGLDLAHSGLVAGFVVGDTRGVPEDVEHDFRASGLSHLLAVSGSNVAFVLALAGPALRRLGLRGRLVGGLFVIALYATMTRFEPSVLRAGAMSSIAMLAACAGRPVSGLRVLSLAVTALLFVDPFLLWAAAFQLSCGASLGILLLAKPIQRRLRGPCWARELLAATAGAQIGVAPVLIPLFGSVPLAAFPANLLAVPAAGPLTVWATASGIVSVPLERVVPGVTTFLQVPTALLVGHVAVVARWCAKLPLAADGRSLLAAAVLAAIAACWRRHFLNRSRAG